MNAPIRKIIQVPVFGTEVSMEITVAMVETIERVFGAGADYIAVQMADPRNLRRGHISTIIAEWICHCPSRPPGVSSRTFQEIREHVFCAKPLIFGEYAGLVQGAIHYTLDYGDSDEDVVDDGDNKKK